MNCIKKLVLILICFQGSLMATETKERTIEEWRQLVASFGKDIGAPAKISTTDFTIPARDGYPIRCRMYNDLLPSDTPVFVFYPGCTFLFDLFDVNSVIASRIAEKSRIKVVLVQFRLAPENSIQTSLDDSYDAAREIALHPDLYGINPAKFFIGGWCSGANAATFVSKHADFNIQHQILLSGNYDLSHSFHAFDEYEAKDTTVSRQLIAYISQRFWSMDSDKNPLFSPYWNEDYSNFPPTTLLCGEFDALRNDTEAYFEKLKAANLPVEKIVLLGQTHNDIGMQGDTDTAEDVASILREIIQKGL